jgi:phosphopantothenoylcysteine decarboxylase / phosphopantothenate---cysteine ligase
MKMLEGKTVLLGLTGGIACYKAAELARLLIKAGARVDTVMTKSAAHFITPLTMQTLTGNPVHTDLFNLIEESEIGHISLAQRADIFVIAPASANCLGKIASGIADDFLTTVVLATEAPVLFCPSMNDKMWANPIVQENVSKLKNRGYHFLDPAAGELACKTSGVGRLPEPTAILAAVASLLISKILKGKNILITAGPTREPIDPVRFISNRSSGKMGYALAEAARDFGAEVTLVAGPVTIPDPPGVKVVKVNTALEMQSEVNKHFKSCHALIMCAAVADFRPDNFKSKKIPKAEMPQSVALIKNADIVAGVSAAKGKRKIIGFAAQTEKNATAKALEKMKSKNLDYIVMNDVSDNRIGFESEENEVVVIDKNGGAVPIPIAPKSAVARKILEIIFS